MSFRRILTLKNCIPKRGLEEFLDSTKVVGQDTVYGRAWKSSELRLKSFEDLHKLWYVLLKERNALLTEFYDCEARNVQMPHPERLHKVKLSMKRLKGVLNERKIEFDKIQESEAVSEGRIEVKPQLEE